MARKRTRKSTARARARPAARSRKAAAPSRKPGRPRKGAAPFRKAARSRNAAAPSRKPAKPRLLSGGNPQITKGEGDAPVQAYIAAMPGWKRDLGRRLDALITRTMPDVRKAVKWNSPFYGVQGQGWFLSFHCFTKYIKVTFFRGTWLRPTPPGESKWPDVRYLDIREDDRPDEAQLADWVMQARGLPGWDGRAGVR